MRILVTGITGQLGFDVMRELQQRGLECRGVTRQEFPLTEHAAVRELLEDWRPDAVIHCAAYTAVDRAEDEPELCCAVNGAATANIARVCADIGAKLVYISTDYVFPGDGTDFYEPESATAPQNAYGRSKLQGEQAVLAVLSRCFIVRISWVFGKNGKNFIRTMLRLAKDHDTVQVVADQFGSPTYTRDLAVLLADMVQSERYGIYHATNEGICSWAELAAEVYRQAGVSTQVLPVGSEAYPVKAKRPKNSRLSKKCLDTAGFSRLPAWQDAVGRYLQELQTSESQG